MIEDLSLNAWPSWQMQVYDGWILRFSHFYTHRTNCVEQIGLSQLPLPEKIAYCEDVYHWWKSPCVFKIQPLSDPALDALLDGRGYAIEHETIVMLRDLRELPAPRKLRDIYTLRVRPHTSRAWIDGLFRLKGGASQLHRRIVPQMYAAVPKEEIAVSVHAGGELIATGLGIIDRDVVGVYAIHTDERCRREGVAGAVVRTILEKAKQRGAANAYLQVVSDNAPAKALYRGLGFTDSYRYYFRTERSQRQGG